MSWLKLGLKRAPPNPLFIYPWLSSITTFYIGFTIYVAFNRESIVRSSRAPGKVLLAPLVLL